MSFRALLAVNNRNEYARETISRIYLTLLINIIQYVYSLMLGGQFLNNNIITEIF